MQNSLQTLNGKQDSSKNQSKEVTGYILTTKNKCEKFTTLTLVQTQDTVS